MDCMMPIMDGYESTIQIKKYIDQQKANQVQNIWHKVDKMFIYALSAGDHQTEVDRCYKVGMDKFLKKPPDIKLMYEVLNAAFPERKFKLLELDKLGPIV